MMILIKSGCRYNFTRTVGIGLLFHFFLLSFGISLLSAQNTEGPVESTEPMVFSDQMRLSRFSPAVRDAKFTAITYGPKGLPIFIGTDRGDVYQIDQPETGWRLILTGTVPDDFIRAIQEGESDDIAGMSELYERDRESLINLLREELRGDVEIEDIEYEDLSFEDIDLNAVDIGDIEFRSEYEPDTVDLDELEEEDIDDIEISDESYLVNPEEVLEQLREEQEEPEVDATDLNRRELEKILEQYRERFFAIRVLCIDEENIYPIVALSPSSLMVKRGSQSRWERALKTDWMSGEFLIDCEKGSSTRFVTVLTGRNLLWSRDEGKNWETTSLPPGSGEPKAIHKLDKEADNIIIVTDSSCIFYQMTPRGYEEDLTPGANFRRINAGTIITSAATAKNIVLYCESGFAVSTNQGKEWRLIRHELLRNTGKVHLLLSDMSPGSIFIFTDNGILMSTDLGQEIHALKEGQLLSNLNAVGEIRMQKSEALFWAINPSVLFRSVFDVIPLSQKEEKPVREQVEQKEDIEFHSTLPPFRQLMKIAARRGLWDQEVFRRWKSRVGSVAFFPGCLLSINYSDRNQATYLWTRDLSFQDEPERYIIGPEEMTVTDYTQQYYSVSVFLKWSLGGLLFHKGPLDIYDRQTKSYKRMLAMQRRFEKIYQARFQVEQRLTDPNKRSSLLSDIDLLLKRDELDALLSNQINIYQPVAVYYEQDKKK